MKMIMNLLSIIVMLIISLIAIFKDYFFKDETSVLVVIALILCSISVASFQINSLLNRFKREKNAQYVGRITGKERLEYPAIKIGASTLVWTGKEGEPIIRIGNDPTVIWLENGKLMISAMIRNEAGRVSAKIDANQWTINPNLLFDRNFDDRAVEVVDVKGNVVLQTMMVEEGVSFSGVFYREDGWRIAIGENAFELKPPGVELETHFDPIFNYPSINHLGERIT
jgi:hypothetical protein